MKIVEKEFYEESRTGVQASFTLANGMFISKWNDLDGWVVHPTREGTNVVVHRRRGGGWWVKAVNLDQWGEDIAGPFPYRKAAITAWRVIR